MALVTPTSGAIHRARPVRNGDVQAWAVSSDNVALTSGTAGATTKSLGSIFHAATIALQLQLMAARLSWAGGAGAGDPILVKLARVDAAGTGGTSKNLAPVDSRDTDPDMNAAANLVTAHFAATNAPTRTILATHMISHATPGTLDLVELVKRLAGKPPRINSLSAEGLEVLIVTGTAGPATACQFALSFDLLALKTG